jgi:hypothetical protein
MKVKLSRFKCGKCGRTLPQDRYVFSRFTGERYCYEGECKKTPTRRKGDA